MLRRVRARKAIEDLEAENSRLREDLERLLEFGKRLIVSDDENERSIGGCICEGTRRVEPGDEPKVSHPQRMTPPAWRWCSMCDAWGDHHTDRHREHCMHWHVERVGTAFDPATEAECVECGHRFVSVSRAPDQEAT